LAKSAGEPDRSRAPNSMQNMTMLTASTTTKTIEQCCQTASGLCPNHWNA
jgi:hypothetical protein